MLRLTGLFSVADFQLNPPSPRFPGVSSKNDKPNQASQAKRPDHPRYENNTLHDMDTTIGGPLPDINGAITLLITGKGPTFVADIRIFQRQVM